MNDDRIKTAMQAAEPTASRDFHARVNLALDTTEAEPSRAKRWLWPLGLAGAAGVLAAGILREPSAPPSPPPTPTVIAAPPQMPSIAVPQFHLSTNLRTIPQGISDAGSDLTRTADRVLTDAAAPWRTLLVAAERAQDAAQEQETPQPTSSSWKSPYSSASSKRSSSA